MQEIFKKIQELLEREEIFAVATIVNAQGSVPRRLAKMIILKDGTTFGTIGGGCAEGQVAALALKMLKDGEKGACVKSFELIEEEYGGVGMNCGGKIDVAIEIIEPTPKLLVAGAGHMAAAIAKIGAMLDFGVIVIDPLANPAKFPKNSNVILEFFDTGIQKVRVSRNTFVVIVTRHKDDLPALRTALKTEAKYIGLIGSRRRVAQVFQLLLLEGFAEADLARVNAPIGLDIGAETPDEIAVSILAEITQLRRLGRIVAAEPLKLKVALTKFLKTRSETSQADIDSSQQLG